VSSKHWVWLTLVVVLLLPFSDTLLPREYAFATLMRPIFIFAILGLGLNIVTGFTGLLNLGIAAFMAVGAYTYGILSADIYPFQLGFWLSIAMSLVVGALAGILLGLPTLRLRGDYLAIVTLGFGEIVQDTLRNLESITKGTTGINPLPGPTFFWGDFESVDYRPSYYLFLGILIVVYLVIRNLEHSRIGRTWLAIREDELAASCMGIRPVRAKLLAFATGAAIASLSGALWAAFLGSTGEPGNYDFQISVMALCIVIVGGMGNINGVLIGAVVMMGFNSIFLVKLTSFFASLGFISSNSVVLSPNNWKYIVFGLALILMMRFKPEGLLGRSKPREAKP